MKKKSNYNSQTTLFRVVAPGPCFRFIPLSPQRPWENAALPKPDAWKTINWSIMCGSFM